MKPLETHFTRKQRGFTWSYQRIARKGLLAIYHRKSGRHNQDFEVIRIQENKAGQRPDFNNPGKFIEVEASESYPNDNAWGTHGWTYTDENAAWMKFDYLREAARVAEEAKRVSQEAPSEASAG